MTYQVLARKWRPQDFSSVIGQEPIMTALRNGLKDNRIAQAYLFSGIRGVGKTTEIRCSSREAQSTMKSFAPCRVDDRCGASPKSDTW